MRIAIVTSRLCDPSDRLALRRFVCCPPGAPEYAMDVQRYIRAIRLEDEPGLYRMVLQYGESAGAPIIGFCEFGYDPEALGDDGYAISFIAVALSDQGRHLGAILLDCVLRWMANDAARYGRTPYVLTQIAPDNEASMRLFSSAGFEDEGEDEDDPGYHIWSKTFRPAATDRLYFHSHVIIDEDRTDPAPSTRA